MSSDFPIVASTIDVLSEDFVKNRKGWENVLMQHDQAVKWCISEGQNKYVNRHIERGMLLGIFSHTLLPDRLARDRIRMLLDQDTPFLELCIFGGYQQPGSSPCASVIAGIGIVRYTLSRVL